MIVKFEIDEHLSEIGVKWQQIIPFDDNRFMVSIHMDVLEALGKLAVGGYIVEKVDKFTPANAVYITVQRNPIHD